MIMIMNIRIGIGNRVRLIIVRFIKSHWILILIIVRQPTVYEVRVWWVIV